MLTPATFHDFVSGRRGGVRGPLVRGALRLAEVPYASAVRLRNWRYDRGHAPVHRVSVPVVSVGNLTLGGTGKTPMVKWLARWFRRHQVRVAIVSRGYAAEQGGRNDEALELEQALQDVPHLQNPDRVEAAQAAIEELAAQVVLLDDGYQHRRLARDLDLVLIDALEPFGYDHLFPRGTLREPLGGLRRAQVVCLTRADLVDEAARQQVRSRIMRHAPQVIWCEAGHRPHELLDSSNRTSTLAELAGRKTGAFCGIGNPEAFRRTLETLGCEIVAWQEFPDHHDYQSADVARLIEWTRSSSAEIIVCTQKDLVKLRVDHLADRPLRAVVVEMDFLAGQQELEKRLFSIVAQVPEGDSD